VYLQICRLIYEKRAIFKPFFTWPLGSPFGSNHSGAITKLSLAHCLIFYSEKNSAKSLTDSLKNFVFILGHGPTASSPVG
jgi:hypothetical protein